MKQTLMAMTAALALAVALPTLAGAQGFVGAGGGGGGAVGAAVPRRAGVVAELRPVAGAEVAAVEVASPVAAVAAHRRPRRAARPRVRSA